MKNNLQCYETTHFLSSKLSLTDKEIQMLYHYQQKVCEKLDWIETNPEKLNQLLSPFLQTNLVNSADLMQILKKIIQSYYLIRSQINYTLSDEFIIYQLSQEYQHSFGLDLTHLASRTMKRIKEYNHE
ncbi:MAG: DUF6323 family protein [Traorella sp.]